MEQPKRYNDFQRYLAAKKSVDNRALNRHVWQSLKQALPQNSEATAPLRIIEIGAGIGTMVERILEWGLLTHAHYILVDEVGANISAAWRQLPQWAEQHGFTVKTIDDIGLIVQITRESTDQEPAVAISVELIESDCFAFAHHAIYHQSADLLIAHALLDLFDIPRALPKLCPLLKPGGLLYTTINFDGNTILQPEIEREFDDAIERAYHATMDQRVTNGQPSGDSRSGRHLFGHLLDAGLSLIDAGSSDWVVFAGKEGYKQDEAYFLHFIVETMHGALQEAKQIDQAAFATWIKKRHAQIERGELIYIAHQLDFLAKQSAS